MYASMLVNAAWDLVMTDLDGCDVSAADAAPACGTLSDSAASLLALGSLERLRSLPRSLPLSHERRRRRGAQASVDAATAAEAR
jgi:hypothetical protein